MMRGVRAKSDGNGGWDVNVQKDVLRKWGPIGLLIFVLVSGAGSRIGGELWTLIVERRVVAEKLEVHDRDLTEGKQRDMDLAAQVDELRVEVRRDLREIKQAVAAIAATQKDGK